MNRMGLLAAWVAATGVATLLAWQVVGAADGQISDAPDTPVIAVTSPEESPATTSPTDDTSTTSTTSETSPSTTDDRGSTTSTTVGSSPSSTVAGSSTSTTTSGIPATTTAVSNGGSVTVTGVEPTVELVAVVAVPGWSYRIDADQGERVQVTFENLAGEEMRVRFEWENGQLVADIDD